MEYYLITDPHSPTNERMDDLTDEELRDLEESECEDRFETNRNEKTNDTDPDFNR